MKFNDTTGGQGIVQDTYFEAGADSISYPIADVTRNTNQAMENVVALSLYASKKWDFGDSNRTDLPIGTTDILINQPDYEFDSEFLTIKAIEVADSNGNWTRLLPIDVLSMDERQALTEFEDVAGIPRYYDKLENSFMLYPVADYNRRLVEESEAGIKVYFQRRLEDFTVSDTTKEPGFAKHLHKYIPLYNAYVYAAAKELSKETSLAKRIEDYEGNKMRGGNKIGFIELHASRREIDNQMVLESEPVNPL